MPGLYVSTKQPLRKVEQFLGQPFAGSEVIECEQSLASYGFTRKVRPLAEPAFVLLIVAVWASVTWFVANYFRAELKGLNWELEPVSWANAVSLGVAIILYRQWRLARYEISIDKYYDRIDSANKRLEALYNNDDREHRYNMLVFAELDKLEYVIFKYDLGFISPVLAVRAANNFKKWCMEEENGARKFDELANYWVYKAGYATKTQAVVDKIRESLPSSIAKANS